ncbi:MAG TPA: phosphate acyltransferase PlsX [Candidatus Binatia bacterium]|nr:phosphate acyltransferase PlsX [Candidatus Binatia bacterium]
MAARMFDGHGRKAPRIAVDAMGGDHAPAEVVAGALLAAAEGHEIVLVGDRAKLAPLIRRNERVEIVDAPEVISMDEAPSAALRRCDVTSLGIAVDLVRDGEADAVVSAGNSGAFLAIALIRLRTIEGIARPAIAAVLPAKEGPIVLIDAGANVDCRPEWLVQFAIMGSAYAEGVLGIAAPRVGIVSVGEERAKGNAQTIEAAALLDAAPVNFVGNVEGKDILFNHADVVVTDGFVGNVILKVGEGAATLLGGATRDTLIHSNALVKLGALLVKPALDKLKLRFSYESYGGAPLLGVRGHCIVAHGRANRNAMRNAIRAASRAARENVVGHIESVAAPLVAKEA